MAIARQVRGAYPVIQQRATYHPAHPGYTGPGANGGNGFEIPSGPGLPGVDPLAFDPFGGGGGGFAGGFPNGGWQVPSLPGWEDVYQWGVDFLTGGGECPPGQFRLPGTQRCFGLRSPGMGPGGVVGPGPQAQQNGVGPIGCPSGYRPNKSAYFLRSGEFVPPQTRCVRIRRRNALNPRALDRAIGRVSSAKRAAKKLSRISIRKKC